MAKKTKPVKEKKSKKDIKSDKCLCSILLGVIGLIAISGVIYYFLTKPKFEVGDCLVNRAYEFKKVYIIDNDEYTLRSVKIDNFPFGADYALEVDYEATYQDKNVDFVDEHYTKVPCQSH